MSRTRESAAHFFDELASIEERLRAETEERHIDGYEASALHTSMLVVLGGLLKNTRT